MGEIKKRWYVVRAVSGKEKKVKEYLDLEISRLKLENFVDQVLIPTEKVFQIRNGKKVSKEKAYLPGYVLIEAALVGEVTHVIKSIPNVIGFLGTEKGGDPVPMRLTEVNRILGKVPEIKQKIQKLEKEKSDIKASSKKASVSNTATVIETKPTITETKTPIKKSNGETPYFN
jgi:transcriptional antiterminator NusG